MARVRLDNVQLQAGVVSVDRSRTIVMSLPAIGFGTEGVIAMSAGEHGPDGMTTGVTGSSAMALVCGFVPVVAGARVDGVTEGSAVSATRAARSGPEEASLEPPSSRATPTTSRTATPSTIIRRTQYTRAGSRRRVIPAMSETLARTPTAPWEPRPTIARMPGVQALLLRWYDEHARDLPWRRTSATPWGVLVSEFMLQQTPVARVLPVYDVWLARWPRPADLAAEPSGEAIRAWGRLGYPRRALRLNAAATAITERHRGEVPDDYDALRALPGVGDYTASAVLAFAFGRRQPVLDTNVRRVLARVVSGDELAPVAVTLAEKAAVDALLPDDEPTAATVSVALMELGALVCTAAAPRCDACPVRDACAWHAAGRPAYVGPPRRGQTWAGTDRQCRGRLMALARDADGPVGPLAITRAWSDAAQRARCLDSLLADGLLVRAGRGYALP
jgi:A/G-specific adenine glycosylase